MSSAKSVKLIFGKCFWIKSCLNFVKHVLCFQMFLNLFCLLNVWILFYKKVLFFKFKSSWNTSLNDVSLSFKVKDMGAKPWCSVSLWSCMWDRSVHATSKNSTVVDPTVKCIDRYGSMDSKVCFLALCFLQFCMNFCSLNFSKTGKGNFFEYSKTQKKKEKLGTFVSEFKGCTTAAVAANRKVSWKH